MLEASGFDFRNRYPQVLALSIAKLYNADKSTVGNTAYNISLDVYRTYAPLKQTTATLAFACVELAGHIHESPIETTKDGKYDQKWNITREEVMGRSYYSIAQQHSIYASDPHPRNPP